MKTTNVIVFDVDQTLINGNLSLLFLRKLMTRNLRFFFLFLPILVRGIILTHISLRKANHILKKHGDIYRFDREIYQLVLAFYQKLFLTMTRCNVLNQEITRLAQELFSNTFFHHHTYNQGIQKIEHHLHNPNTIVVLLSGSMQPLVEIFFNYLCKQMDQKQIAWQNRFFAVGTTFGKNLEDVRPCFGSEKIILLKKLLDQQKCMSYEVQFIYSDNHFMADLPLLIASKNGGLLVRPRNATYDQLPQNLTKNLIFLPFWGKQ